MRDDLSICRECKDSLSPGPLPLCQRCSHPLRENACPSCSQFLLELETHKSAFFYHDLGKQLIQAYKFEKRKSYAKTIADISMTTQASFLKQFDIMVPVTITKRDYFERDFCPVLTVCKHLAKRLKIKIVVPMIKLPTKKAQHHKTRQERKEGVAKQYRARPRKMKQLRHKNVLVVDDVLTTGATLETFCHHIAKHSPRRLATFSFARSLLE